MPLLVVFDEDCGVCQASVGWLRRRDRSSRFQFVGNRAAELPAGVPRAQTDETLFVVETKSGEIRNRADGVAWLLRSLGGWQSIGWRALGVLIPIPGIRQLANLSYRTFARHRHQVSAALGMNACAVPERTDRTGLSS